MTKLNNWKIENSRNERMELSKMPPWKNGKSEKWWNKKIKIMKRANERGWNEKNGKLSEVEI